MPKTNVRGLEMFYESQGDGPAVILIAGLSQDHLAWMFQVPALTAAGYRCIVFDNRDAGQSGESPSSYGVRQLADDTVGLMDALGVTAAHVVGLSMGGMIGQEMAIANPDRISSLTLVCTGAFMPPETAGVLRAWRASRPHGDPVEFVLMLSSWLFTHRFFQQPEAVAGFLEMVRANPFPQSAAAFQRQCDAVLSHDARARLSRIAAPTHVIVGSEDVLTPPRQSRALAESIAGAKLTEIPAAGHVLSIETADAFNQNVIEFLDAQRARVAV